MPDLIPVFDDYSHPKINDIIKQALGCPKCGARSPAVMSENRAIPRYLVVCRECAHPGPLGSNLAEAIKQWNKPPGLCASFVEKWGRI